MSTIHEVPIAGFPLRIETDFPSPGRVLLNVYLQKQLGPKLIWSTVLVHNEALVETKTPVQQLTEKFVEDLRVLLLTKDEEEDA